MITCQDGSTSLNPEADWSKDKDDKALGNDKALVAISDGVDKNMFRLINLYIEAKEAWEVLNIAHEGTSMVRMSRLQLLTTKFENLRVLEDESMFEFNICLHYIANNYFSLAEKIS